MGDASDLSNSHGAESQAETCFVIQPFDGGPYDKRYDEIIGPAIVAAGLTPYRVDRDRKVDNVIEHIQVQPAHDRSG